MNDSREGGIPAGAMAPSAAGMIDIDALSDAQIEAIADMAENRIEYNTGVLAMLGQRKAAVELRQARGVLDAMAEQRNAALGEVRSFEDMLAVHPMDGQIEAQRRRVADLWRPIAALIGEARAALEHRHESLRGLGPT